MSDDLPDIDMEPHKMKPLPFKPSRKFTLEGDLLPFVSGSMELPNFEPIEHWKALRASMGYGRTIERFTPAGQTYDQACKARVGGKGTGTAIFYMNCGQGGGYTGEGTVVANIGYSGGPDSIVTGTFALCRHKAVEDPGADHMRGWHPAHCELCGLDMSVDSGD